MLTKEFLEKNYVNEHKSIRQIHEETGVPRQKISKMIKDYDLPFRGTSWKGRRFTPYQSMNKTELIGQRFGHLVVERYEKGGWICICDCGNVKQYKTCRLTQKYAQTCGCRSFGNGYRLGHKGIPNVTYNNYRRDAEKRGVEFNVSIEYIANLLIKQGYKCSLSGVDIWIKTAKDKTASLDRIDSTKGYVEGNLQWVHKQINQMKWDTPQSEFIKWCISISDHYHTLR